MSFLVSFIFIQHRISIFVSSNFSFKTLIVNLTVAPVFQFPDLHLLPSHTPLSTRYRSCEAYIAVHHV